MAIFSRYSGRYHGTLPLIDTDRTEFYILKTKNRVRYIVKKPINTKAILKENFLSCFDDNMRNAIVEYGKLITKISGEYDVLMFMARKAVCLVEAMKILDLVSFQGTTASNRVLDFNNDWLKGKKVAVVDDALISGTSIYRVKKRLEKIGCQSDIFALCTNEGWKKEGFIDPKPPYIELTDSECASLCSDIVTAISVIPLPYSTDYPFYSGIRLKADELSELASLPIWSINDLTTNIQRELVQCKI